MGRGTRGGVRGGSRASNRGNLANTLIPDGLQSKQNYADGQPSFSLRQEALNTERHHSWNSDLKLRHSQVSFVSAGRISIAPEDRPHDSSVPKDQSTVRRDTPEDIMAEMSLEDRLRSASSEPLEQEVTEKPSIASGNRHTLQEGHLGSRNGEDLFFVDMKGSFRPVQTAFAPPVLPRSPSPGASDSSEEIIIFTGRNQSYTKACPKQQCVISGFQDTDRQEQVTRDDIPTTAVVKNSKVIQVTDPVPPSTSLMTNISRNEQNATSATLPPQFTASNGTKHQIRPRIHRRRPQNKERNKRSREDEILADYIANISENDIVQDPVDHTATNNRELAGVGVEVSDWQDETDESSLAHQISGPVENDAGWNKANLQDFYELGTSNEILGNVECILSKRERSTGLQYLVVWEGCTVDDARWIPLGSLGMSGAEEHIRAFEAQQKMTEQQSLNCEDSDEVSGFDKRSATDLEEEEENSKNEQHLFERRKARITDEQLARLLSKQEELGLGSNELILFDGDEEEKVVVEEALQAFTTSFKYRSSRHQKRRNHSNVFSAGEVGEVPDQEPYDGFDVMDHDSLSLREKLKGRRDVPFIELSDSEMEMSMQYAWKNDRIKKRIRKQEREELRAEGLLGKKNKPDLKAKYVEGMSMNDIKKEIRDFLISKVESLSLPPMDHKVRKIVHEMANALKLKSKSVGSGNSRFPVLYKTSRTGHYDEDALKAVDTQMGRRRFLPRMNMRRKRGPATTPGRKRGGGFVATNVSYLEGEVVGAAAPELGTDNKGRAMLEKMGWSTGTALGALNNKGIMQPVAQVVKTTKAGLG